MLRMGIVGPREVEKFSLHPFQIIYFALLLAHPLQPTRGNYRCIIKCFNRRHMHHTDQSAHCRSLTVIETFVVHLAGAVGRALLANSVLYHFARQAKRPAAVSSFSTQAFPLVQAWFFLSRPSQVLCPARRDVRREQ